jgi:hypothetical protein
MGSVLQLDLPWLTLRSKLVQEDEQGILYKTMFDDYILDNSKIQMVERKRKNSKLYFYDFSLIQVLWKIYICGKICLWYYLI